MVNQIVHVIQIQHDTGSTRAAAGKKKGARVLEAEWNEISYHLQYDLCPHEREHIVQRTSGSAPTVARAIRNEPEGTNFSFHYGKISTIVESSNLLPRWTIPTRDSHSTNTDSPRGSQTIGRQL